jgi:hypothetical protein
VHLFDCSFVGGPVDGSLDLPWVFLRDSCPGYLLPFHFYRFENLDMGARPFAAAEDFYRVLVRWGDSQIACISFPSLFEDSATFSYRFYLFNIKYSWRLRGGDLLPGILIGAPPLSG